MTIREIVDVLNREIQQHQAGIRRLERQKRALLEAAREKKKEQSKCRKGSRSRTAA